MTGLLARLTVDRLRAAWARLGYVWFTGDLNLNLFGIRAAEPNPERFDDAIGVAYELNGDWHVEAWPATTDPSTYLLRRPANIDGTAVLCPGQWRGVFVLGLHKGLPALVQRGARVDVWRDNDKNGIINVGEGDPVHSGWFGINLHRAGTRGTGGLNTRWSAGCQVMPNVTDLTRLLALCQRSTVKYGERITYTLITEGDLLLG